MKPAFVNIFRSWPDWDLTQCNILGKGKDMSLLWAHGKFVPMILGFFSLHVKWNSFTFSMACKSCFFLDLTVQIVSSTAKLRWGVKANWPHRVMLFPQVAFPGWLGIFRRESLHQAFVQGPLKRRMGHYCGNSCIEVYGRYTEKHT